MNWGICTDCGKLDYLEKHHVVGRQIDPNNVISLCLKCHHLLHNSMLIVYDNAASQKYRQWREQQLEAGHYVKISTFQEQLEAFGYVPMPDGWEHWEDADRIRQQLIEQGWIAK